MLVVVGVLPALIAALVATYLLVRRSRRRRTAGRDPLTRVFHPLELRELDAHLDAVAEKELRHLDDHIARYVAGDVGHVVVIADSRHEIALLLSDGRRMALGGVSRVSRRALVNRAARDKLRPALVERDGLSYRLLLRSEAGAEIEIHPRRVALAP